MPPEPLPMQALHREATAVAAPGSVAPGAFGDPLAPPVAFDPPNPAPKADFDPAQTATSSERARVQIDQIDVVIHEESTSSNARTGGDTLGRDLSRRLRSTYLRGL